ncbi:acyltransferase family protein, partial [Bradyrhizobium sp.]|uniref:acyltransferase family protein n=1 Tax=Bradyrhizobium sp. TaxID=376 RepID=UPI003C48B938
MDELVTRSSFAIGPLRAALDHRKFYPELEALRGVAALIVVIFHAVGGRSPTPALLNNPSVDGVANLILTSLFPGTGAVALFFVLSGFVLGANVQPSGALSPKFYVAFAIRRLFRLMPSLWLSLALAMALFGNMSLFHLSALWVSDAAMAINGPLWSLRIELIA